MPTWPPLGARLPLYSDRVPPGALADNGGVVAIVAWDPPPRWSGWTPFGARLPTEAPAAGYWNNGGVLSFAAPATAWAVLMTELGPLYASFDRAPPGALVLNGTDVNIKPL